MMRKHFTAIAIIGLLLIIPFLSNAETKSGTCGSNVYWNLNGDVLTISGTGDMYNYKRYEGGIYGNHDNVPPWSKDSYTIHSVIVEEGITGIGSNVFTSFGGYGVTISLPETLTKIGEGAFRNSSFQTVNIPQSVTYIGPDVFRDCQFLKSIAIPFGVTTIKAYTFSRCYNLVDVSLPDTLTTIEDGAFSDCTSMQSITIPSNVTDIGIADGDQHGSPGFTFSLCTNLTDIYFTGNAPTIHGSIFANTTATVHYPANNPTYTDEVRQNYSGTITWEPYNNQESGTCGTDVIWTRENNVLTISGTGAMDNYSATNGPGWKEKKSYITSIIIEDGVTNIGAYAFYGCDYLASVTIPNTVKSIGEYAFQGSNNLADVFFGGTKDGWRKFSEIFEAQSPTIHYGRFTILYDNNARFGYYVPDIQYKELGIPIKLSDRIPQCSDWVEKDISSVTLYPNKGSFQREDGLLSGNSIILYANRITKYTFKEWNTSTIGIGASYKPGSIYEEDSDLKLYGQWDEETEITAIQLPAPVRSGYVFKGWALSRSDTEGIIGEYIPEANEEIIFYATWGYPPHVHTEVIDAYVAPTCTETGLTEGSHCATCGEVICPQEVIPKTEHTETIDEAVEPTCISTGLTEGKHCSVCNEVLVPQEIIPIVDHQFDYFSAVDPTCTEDGYTEGFRCKVCQLIEAGCETIPATGHTVVIEEGEEATCIKEGKTEGRYCSVCGLIIQKQETIPKTAHQNVIDPSVPATCTEEGLTAGYHCKNCGTVFVGQKSVPALGHDWGDTVFEIIPESNHVRSYRQCSRDASHIESKELNTIVLPNSLREIHEEAFANLSCEAVIIPKECLSIDQYAFRDCLKLEYVSVPDSTIIDPKAFDGCENVLIEITNE